MSRPPASTSQDRLLHPVRRSFLLGLLAIGVLFASTGCLMQRTVTNGNEVVAQGYVIKGPLAPVITP